jgi:hypothetical protein
MNEEKRGFTVYVSQETYDRFSSYQQKRREEEGKKTGLGALAEEIIEKELVLLEREAKTGEEVRGSWGTSRSFGLAEAENSFFRERENFLEKKKELLEELAEKKHYQLMCEKLQWQIDLYKSQLMQKDNELESALGELDDLKEELDAKPDKTSMFSNINLHTILGLLVAALLGGWFGKTVFGKKHEKEIQKAENFVKENISEEDQKKVADAAKQHGAELLRNGLTDFLKNVTNGENKQK